MKKIVLITAILITATFANAQMMGNNQMQQNQGHGTMMQQDMMHPMHQQMMQQQMPMQRYMMMVKMLPNMQEYLSLSDDQNGKLIDMQAGFKKQQADYEAELNKKRMKLKSLLKDNASADDVKKQMLQCASSKVDMGISAYETALKMEGVLSSEQKKEMKSFMQNHKNMKMQRGSMHKSKMNK
ncbi:MAG: hypothetical protein PF489_11040 [Salinivirgaceae bacterium]|jgi:nitrate reductase cytochrome c-type subunit|nr:hypothetical protein [Salinivirgaceae bacterium]